MHKFLLIPVALGLIGLAACATGGGAPVYHQAASAPNSIGYSEKQIDGLRYRVTFTAPQSTGAQRAQDYALLRAAELTQEKGHPWFRLANRTVAQVQVEAPKIAVQGTSTQSYSCGGGGSTSSGMSSQGCSYAPSNDTIAGAKVGVTGTNRIQVVAVIEFVMGDGEKPAAGATPVYDAKETAASLRASMAAAQ